MRYTSTARKDGRWWVVQNDQHPGAISQLTQLSQAADHQREAIAFVADVDPDDIEVEVRPVVDHAVEKLIAEAAYQRETAEALMASASDNTRKAVHVMRDQGLTVRDIGTILGVSFQRAAQLLNS